ncbi:MAG: hypothetical protein ACYSWY_09380 [Planctomycetota bacterium]
MRQLLSAFLAGLVVAFIVFMWRPRLEAWPVVLLTALFPFVFWLAQAAIDSVSYLLKPGKE